MRKNNNKENTQKSIPTISRWIEGQNTLMEMEFRAKMSTVIEKGFEIWK